jgi:hypothetical protein
MRFKYPSFFFHGACLYHGIYFVTAPVIPGYVGPCHGRRLTVQVRIQSHASICVMCGSGTGFLPKCLGVPFVRIIPLVPHIHSLSWTLFYYSRWYLHTPWSRVLLEKLTDSAASQEIPRILWNPKVPYRTHKCRHMSLSWANSIHSPQRPPTSWRSKLNKQSRTADEGWSSSLGFGRGANNASPWKPMLRNIHKSEMLPLETQR